MTNRFRLFVVLTVFGTLMIPGWGNNAVAGDTPLKDDFGGLQRVLTLPDAKRHKEPNADSKVLEDNIPVFSVRYVYERSEDKQWTQVGSSATGKNPETIGWIATERLQDWKSMLVMQYAPKGQRERTIFFQKKAFLKMFVGSPTVKTWVKKALAAIKAGKQKKGMVMSLESFPAVADRKDDDLYLMPITAFEYGQFRDGWDTTLLEVASLNAKDPATPPPLPDSEENRKEIAEPFSPKQDLKTFKVGVVFVIDTTRSMQRFIDKTHEIVSQIYRSLQGAGLQEMVRFGLVGYRDNLVNRPGIEYITRVYQGLDQSADPIMALNQLRHMRVTPSSTKGWDEDAFAGVAMALNDSAFRWSEFDVKLLFLITDAGPRQPMQRDRLASTRYDAASLSRLAQEKGVAIMPIHLLTPGAQKQRNLSWVQEQYRILSLTGDKGANKYLPIRLRRGMTAGFAWEIQSMAKGLTEGLTEMAKGDALEKPDIAMGGGAGGMGSMGGGGAAPEPTEPSVPRAEQLIRNEMFRGQSEYVGNQTGEKAPRFYKAWVSDRDLTAPSRPALEVKVFLSKTQLNKLAKTLTEIVEKMRENEMSPGGFFDELQALSGSNSVDAANPMKKLLPKFLEGLPYKSKILALSKESWMDWGMSGRSDFIDELESKQEEYEDINNTEEKWKRLDPKSDEKVYPVNLESLP